MKGRRPNFFIVGAPKCGTTSLYNYLRQHPDIFMPEKKEPHYFCTDFYKPPRLTEAQYLDLFSDAGEEKRIGEGSTWYIYSEEARRRIMEFASDARIIIMLRNPVDMMYSLHAQRLWLARENIQDFEEALEAEEDRRIGRRLPPYPFPLQLLFYRTCGTYSPHVQAYFDRFGRDRVKVIVFEEFAAETEGIYREVCEFLEIDPDFLPPFLVHNANKKLRSFRFRQLMRSPRTKRLGLYFPRRIRRGVKEIARDLNTRVIKREPISVDLKQRLMREFREECAALGRLLERDLDPWWYSLEGKSSGSLRTAAEAVEHK